MPRLVPALTAARVAQLVREGTRIKAADGGCPGLTLKVSDKGRASWVLRYTAPDGKRADMGLGSVALTGTTGGVSLAEARRLVDQHSQAKRAGGDPLQAKRQRRADASAQARAEAPSTVPTFRRAAEEFIATREAGWTNAKHGAQWTSTLRRYAFPVIGALPVDSITTEHVLAALRPVWTTTPETGSRLRQRIEAVLDAAKALGHRQGENPARWKGHLAQLLPPPRRVRAVAHHPSLPWQQVPAFLAVLEGKAGMSAGLLRFLILTASRSGEARGATWGEMDPEAGVWTVPAARMKAKKAHRVPLTAPVLDILHSRRLAAQAEHGPEALQRDALIFPSRGEKGLRHPVSDMALSMLLRGMSLDGLAPDALPRWRDQEGRAVVPHGLRSTFKAWSLAQGWQDHLSESALAHTDPNAVRAAYARGDLLGERRALMDAWASFATGRAGGVLVPIRIARGA